MPQTPETVHAVCQKWMDKGRVPKHLHVNEKGQMRKEHAAAILQYISDHFDGHVTLENLDHALTRLMRMEKIPSPPKPELSEAEKQKQHEAEEHRRQVQMMGLVTPNRINHAHKEVKEEKPVQEKVQDLRDRMRSNIESVLRIQKPEPKLKRLRLNATEAQLKAASPEQLRDYINRKKHEQPAA